MLVVGVCALLGTESYVKAALWLSIVAVADIWLTVLDRLFQRRNPADSELAKWGWARSMASGGRGLAWSLGPYLIYVPGDTVSLVLPVWGLLNLMAASVYTASPFFPCLLMTVIFGIAPASAWLLYQGTPATNLAALLLIMATPFLAFIGMLGRRNIGALIGGRLDLAEMLARQERQTEIVQQTMAERTRFFSAASHDLRQPLQALGFYVALLAGKVGDSENDEILDRILECNNSLNRQFHALLGIAAADAAVRSAEPVAMPLRTLFERVAISIGPEAEVKNLKLRIVPTRCWVSVNPGLLERVLLNLASNAVRYTAAGGVLLGARLKPRTAEIWVVDTGIGIADQHRSKIFDEFYQINNPSRDREMGFGLGLSTVRRLCTGLGWPLDVRSVPGKGSIFKVTVPLTAPRDAEVADVAIGPTQPPNEAIRVLVLDDDPLVRDAMERLIAGWGYPVRVCRTGDEAMAALQSSAATVPWCVLVDYRLAGDENGLAVIERLRGAPGKNLHMVLMTAETDEAIFRSAERQHIVALRKPIKPIRLRAVLSSAATPQQPMTPAAE